MTWEFILGHINYWLFIVLMLIGLYIVIAKGNLLKKIVGLNIFQCIFIVFHIPPPPLKHTKALFASSIILQNVIQIKGKIYMSMYIIMICLSNLCSISSDHEHEQF